MEQKKEQHTHTPSVKRKLGNTTYTVRVHFRKNTDKTFKGNVQRLIINECLEKSGNNPHNHLTKLIRTYQNFKGSFDLDETVHPVFNAGLAHDILIGCLPAVCEIFGYMRPLVSFCFCAFIFIRTENEKS